MQVVKANSNKMFNDEKLGGLSAPVSSSMNDINKT